MIFYVFVFVYLCICICVWLLPTLGGSHIPCAPHGGDMTQPPATDFPQKSHPLQNQRSRFGKRKHLFRGTFPIKSIFSLFFAFLGIFRRYDAAEARGDFPQWQSRSHLAGWRLGRGVRQCAQCARQCARTQMPLLLILAAAGTGVAESGSEEEEGEECGAGKWQSSRRRRRRKRCSRRGKRGESGFRGVGRGRATQYMSLA